MLECGEASHLSGGLAILDPAQGTHLTVRGLMAWSHRGGLLLCPMNLPPLLQYSEGGPRHLRPRRTTRTGGRVGLCRFEVQLLSNNNATTATGEFVITRMKSFPGKYSTLRQYTNLLVFCRPGPLRSNNVMHASAVRVRYIGPTPLLCSNDSQNP